MTSYIDLTTFGRRNARAIERAPSPTESIDLAAEAENADPTENADQGIGDRRSVGNTRAAIPAGRGGRGGRGRGQGRQPKARYWLATIRAADWEPPTELPEGIEYIGGQKERGEGENGYEHWQLIICVKTQQTLSRVKELIGSSSAHLEVTRSEAARDYAFKEETRIEGTQFSLGQYPFRRNAKVDWNEVLESAKKGRFDDIDAGVRIRNYASLKRIFQDSQVPATIRRHVEIHVLFGDAGTGKTHTCWEKVEAMGLSVGDVYIKQGSTKWWCGYRGQKVVIMDDFMGKLDLGDLKTWTDIWPAAAEEKGGRVTLVFDTMYITSNRHPRLWYPDEPQPEQQALMRRITTLTEYIRESEDVVSVVDRTADCPRPIRWSAPPSQNSPAENNAIVID